MIPGIKKEFPIFQNNPGLIYFDSGATTLKPASVLASMDEYYQNYGANVHRGIYPMSEKATLKYEEVRAKIAKFIGALYPEEIIFTSGTTSALNLAVFGWASHNLEAGDEILISEMEHHSNLVPWQALAEEKKLKIKYWPVEDYKLNLDILGQLIDEKTKILAVTQVSNVIGTVNPVEEIVKRAKLLNPNIVVVVDGAQAVAHFPVDVNRLGCDFYAFSGHKMYGPTGVGVLWTKMERQLQMKPVNFGGGMISEVSKNGYKIAEGPEGFEAGTPPIAEVIVLGAAVDFILGLGFKNIIDQENNTLSYLLSEIKKVSGLKVLGSLEIEDRAGVVSVVSEAVHGHDIATLLSGGRRNVAVRAGFHCAMPLHQALGEDYGSTRISLGVYNDKEDIDKLIGGLKSVQETFMKEKEIENKFQFSKSKFQSNSKS